MIAGSVPLQVIVWRTIARERVATATRLSALVGLAGLALIVVPGGSRRLDRGRARADARRARLVVDGLVRLEPALAPAPTRSSRPSTRCSAVAPCSSCAASSLGEGGDLDRRRLACLARRLALPRRRGLADRVHGVRVAPPQRADLAGRHAPVRQPARRDRARRGAPRRDARRDDAGRRADRDRRRLRHDPERGRAAAPVRWSGAALGRTPRPRRKLRSGRPACGGARGTRAGRSA